MRSRIDLLAVLVFALTFALTPATARAADDQPQRQAFRLINQARRNLGLPLLAWNDRLAQAAQRHSEDMAGKGFVDLTGTDASVTASRARAAGYAGWGERLVVSEAVFAGPNGFLEALDFMLADERARRVLLSRRHREVGVGVSRDGQRAYWSVVAGAQPNLLPIFINDDDPVTNRRQVAVQLTQEEVFPEGTPTTIGQVTEIRLSEQPDFADAEWRAWEPLVPFTLSPGAGTKTVFVQMRDARGVVTLSADTIDYDPLQPMSPRPTPVLSGLETPGEPPLVLDETSEPLPTPMPATTPAPPTPVLMPTVPLVVPAVTPAVPNPQITLVLPTVTPMPTAPPPVSASASNLRWEDWLLPIFCIVQGAILALAVSAFVRARPDQP